MQAQMEELRKNTSVAAACSSPSVQSILEWFYEYHDRDTPVAGPAKLPLLSCIVERPYTTTLVLLHVYLLWALVLNASLPHWLTNNPPASAVFVLLVDFLWIFLLGMPSTKSVVYYRIELDTEQIVVHTPSGFSRVRIITVPFFSITSVCPRQYDVYSEAGFEISYLDEKLTFRKLRVPENVPATLIESHMNALRAAIGHKVEEMNTYSS